MRQLVIMEWIKSVFLLNNKWISFCSPVTDVTSVLMPGWELRVWVFQVY